MNEHDYSQCYSCFFFLFETKAEQCVWHAGCRQIVCLFTSTTEANLAFYTNTHLFALLQELQMCHSPAVTACNVCLR